MGKRVPQTKFTELKGLDRISIVAHEMNCLFRTITQDDVGIDGELEVTVPVEGGNGRETRGGIIKVQAKSGKSFVKRDSPESFATPVKQNDLAYWNDCPFPVFFIVYHPDDDALYFKEVTKYVHETTNVWQSPFEIRFRKATDQFSKDAREKTEELADCSPPRISFEGRERLFSNLFRITKLPTVIWMARTRRKSWRSVKESINGFTHPFFIHAGSLYSLGDLRDDKTSLRNYCDTDTVETITVDEMLDELPLRDGVQFMLRQLIAKHCGRLKLRFNKDRKRYYFPREDAPNTSASVADEFRREWTSPRTKKSSERAVAKKYAYGDDGFSFWRHLAAEIDVVATADAHYLQIVPKYLFTIDGKKLLSKELTSKYTTKQKANDLNPQVMNHVLFWGQTLANSGSKMSFQLDGRTVMTADAVPEEATSSFILPYDPALFEEEQDGEIQMDLFGLDAVEGTSNVDFD